MPPDARLATGHSDTVVGAFARACLVGNLGADAAYRWEGTLIAARADKSSAPFDAFYHMIFGVLLR
jgi:hypothetical protein